MAQRAGDTADADAVSATVLLERDAYEQLRRAAFEDHRSMSAIVRDALANWLRERGAGA